MKIYLIEEDKKELKAKIEELDYLENSKVTHVNDYIALGKKRIYEEMLEFAIVLPIEKSWIDVSIKSTNDNCSIPYQTQELYPNGLIIKTE